jgi:hypothetical protein
MGAQQTELHRMVRLLAGISDPVLAVSFVRHELARMTPDQSAALLGEIGAATEVRDPASAHLMLLVSIALASPECEALRVAIAEAAEARGDREVARRLVGEGAPMEVGEEALRVPDFGAGRPLTLGERKSLARRRDRQLLLRILGDPSPDVIRILLGNPALTEADVVRLCARRPIAPQVLREVFCSPRWMLRYAVRLAICRNPYTPLELALSLVPHLTLQDARELAMSADLPEALRDACALAARPRTIH